MHKISFRGGLLLAIGGTLFACSADEALDHQPSPPKSSEQLGTVTSSLSDLPPPSVEVDSAGRRWRVRPLVKASILLAAGRPLRSPDYVVEDDTVAPTSRTYPPASADYDPDDELRATTWRGNFEYTLIEPSEEQRRVRALARTYTVPGPFLAT